MILSLCVFLIWWAVGAYSFVDFIREEGDVGIFEFIFAVFSGLLAGPTLLVARRMNKVVIFKKKG